MPTVLRTNGFRFFFFSNEGDEPPHVHVQRGDCVAKFWLVPPILDDAEGCHAPGLSKAGAIVSDRSEFLLERWHEFFGSKD